MINIIYSEQHQENDQYQNWSVEDIFNHLQENGYDINSLTELEVLRYCDQYRTADWLITALKNKQHRLDNPKPKRKRRQRHLQKTPGRSAAVIVKQMTADSLMDDGNKNDIPFMGEPCPPPEAQTEADNYCVRF